MKKSIIAIVVLVVILIIVVLVTHKSGSTSVTNPTGTTVIGSTDNSGSGSQQGSGNSSTVSATTTASASTSPSVIELDGVSPTTGAVGATIFLTGSGFTDTNTILFNSNVAAKDVHIASTQAGKQMIFFTVPSSIGPDCQPNEACPQYMQEVTPGTYQLSVENENGKSNVLQFNVTAK